MDLFPFLKRWDSKKTPEIEQINYSYQDELERIRSIWRLWNATTDEKISFLDFAIQVVGNDVQCQHFAQFFYEKVILSHPIRDLIPIDRIVDEKAIYEKFPLNNHLVITIPYELKKIRDANRDIEREGYRPDVTDNVDGFYISEFNAVFLENGRHYIVAAIAKGVPCYAHITEYSLKDAFPVLNVSSHGTTWIFTDTHSGREMQINVIDPRIALMYDLAKERYLLQEKL